VDDRIFIKAVERLGQASLRFYCSGYGLEWTATKELTGLQTLVEGLRAKYPKALALQENQVKRFLNIIAGESDAADDEGVMALVNKVLAESMCVLYVVKTDRAFRDFFEIDDQLDNTPIANKRASGVVGAAVSQTHYVSFLSQAKR
jgi:signal transduction histidine kinase